MKKKTKQKIKIISWNINGIRAAYKKGLIDFIINSDADIYCFQETKACKDQLSRELLNIKGYKAYFSSPVKKGYSGVGIYSRIKPEEIFYDVGVPEFDNEGRIIGFEFANTIIFNVYFPNGGASPERLAYKMRFYDFFLEFINKYRNSGKNLIFCGDVNTAHNEIDLARPAANKNNTGFLPQERAWIDRLIGSRYVDAFRLFDKGPGNYTWWDYKTRARERNVGWRLDYFFTSSELAGSIADSYILNKVMGSDHCPIVLEINTDMQY
ncbi:MAG TPA: exodeoxyribonuclease III [Actinobacteria bacterium]|nr:exodeoxyribonuclease III [Actinomycetota bacterium]